MNRVEAVARRIWKIAENVRAKQHHGFLPETWGKLSKNAKQQALAVASFHLKELAKARKKVQKQTRRSK